MIDSTVTCVCVARLLSVSVIGSVVTCLLSVSVIGSVVTRVC